MRVRENSEQIALLQGRARGTRAAAPRASARVVDNWLGIMSRTKKITAFTASYLAGRGDLSVRAGGPGLLRQQDSARRHDAGRRGVFGSVQGALSFFVSAYRHARRMAARWSTVWTALRPRSRAPQRRSRAGDAIQTVAAAMRRPTIALRLILVAPAERHSRWWRPTVSACAAATARCVTGPSGSGKSTLFRAIAGIWPFGNGRDSLFPRTPS